MGTDGCGVGLDCLCLVMKALRTCKPCIRHTRRYVCINYLMRLGFWVILWNGFFPKPFQ